MINQASGCIILSTKTQRILLQLRSPDRKYKSYWGFWGGGVESGELPIETLQRELQEEIGFVPDIIKFYPLHKLLSDDQTFEYLTFVVTVDDEFIPVLNSESAGFAWVDYDRYPAPLHPGAKVILDNPRIMSKLKTIVSQLQ